MSWQVNRALAYIAQQAQLSAEHVEGELIRIAVEDQPNVLAAISAADEIGAAMAASYRDKYPDVDFLCGYRRTCVWQG